MRQLDGPLCTISSAASGVGCCQPVRITLADGSLCYVWFILSRQSRATVFRWLASNQEFRQLYVLARQCQAEDLADEILKIADDSSRDYKEKIGADGKVDLGRGSGAYRPLPAQN